MAKTVTGQISVIDGIDASDTIQKVKDQTWALWKGLDATPSDTQLLLHDQPLENDRTLRDYGISDASELRLEPVIDEDLIPMGFTDEGAISVEEGTTLHEDGTVTDSATGEFIRKIDLERIMSIAESRRDEKYYDDMEKLVNAQLKAKGVNMVYKRPDRG